MRIADGAVGSGTVFRQPLSPARWTARSLERAVARKGGRTVSRTVSRMSAEKSTDAADLPQLWASSLSAKKELVPAIEEAATKALAQFPEGASIDLALIHVSSIYGNAEKLETVVPELRKVVPGLDAVVGCSSAGAVGMQSKDRAVEIENRTCFGLTLASLPGVKVKPFYLAAMDIPDPLDPPSMWKKAVQLRDGDMPVIGADGETGEGGEGGVGEPIFLSYSTTQSIDALGDYLAGMDAAFPRSQKVAAIASTVSR
eukprot:jgi/Undpi1/653/HiC_scaffold_10.g04117.m1